MKKYALFLIPILLIVAFVSMANAGSEKKEFQGTFLKGNSMKEQTDLTSSNENNTKSSEGSGWLKNQVSSVVVGVIVATIVSVVVIIVQVFFVPMIAKRVKREESILEQRYNACESAVNILQRYLASVQITGKPVPSWYIPPEKNPPTQLEMNVAYTLLAIYGKSKTIAEEFFAATGPGKTDPADIVKFVSAVRKELGVDKRGFTGDFHYRLLRPVDENRQKDKEPKDEQEQ